jgi:hypothetical protein
MSGWLLAFLLIAFGVAGIYAVTRAVALSRAKRRSRAIGVTWDGKGEMWGMEFRDGDSHGGNGDGGNGD